MLRVREQATSAAWAAHELHVMKIMLPSLRVSAGAAGLILALAVAACTHDSTAVARKPIPLAPVGVASSGIGGPGGDSIDTRATGTVATGEGDQPLDARSGVAPVTAAPGSVRAVQGKY